MCSVIDTLTRGQMFDGLIHFSFEAGFLYYSVLGRTIATSEGFIPEMGTLSQDIILHAL